MTKIFKQAVPFVQRNCKVADELRLHDWPCSEFCEYRVVPCAALRRKGFFCAYQKMPELMRIPGGSR